jgi:hypothetical protein
MTHMTKQEMQRELRLLRKQLRENQTLLRWAMVRCEDMMALRDQHEALKQELARVKDNGVCNQGTRFKYWN